MQAHQDAVWSLCAHPSEHLLFSASADATIAVWSLKASHAEGSDQEEEEEGGPGGGREVTHMDDLVFPTVSSPPL